MTATHRTELAVPSRAARARRNPGEAKLGDRPVIGRRMDGAGRGARIR